MLSCKHSKFTLSPRVTYLNCAYMAPLLKVSEKAGIRGVRIKRDPTKVSPSSFFDGVQELKSAFAKTIHCINPSRIAIVPSVSYGMATVARNVLLRKGEKILVAAEQFPSNYYAWKRKCDENGAILSIVSPPDTLTNRGRIWNERLLDAISPGTKVVALGHVHWADGTKFDLAAIRRKATEVGALLVIDGTQSVGALPFDVNVFKPDALFVAGYKWLLGPYSIGMAYFGEAFDGGIPLEENWINRKDSEDFTKLINYTDEYKEGAMRFSVGEQSNFILVPMMLKALEQINKWGPANIQEYCQSITANAIQRLRENKVWVEDDEFRGSHLFGVRFRDERDLEKVKAALLKRNIYVSVRGNSIRVSPNIYNTEADLMKLVSVLTSK
jgi:selenocysteine lyase/cysteine desulfurase